jgi:hypothetical protein
MKKTFSKFKTCLTFLIKKRNNLLFKFIIKSLGINFWILIHHRMKNSKLLNKTILHHLMIINMNKILKKKKNK